MEYSKVSQEINNITGENIEKLAKLFPEVVRDGKIDFDCLKEELGEAIEKSEEKYELTWAGKRQAKALSRQDIIGKTLAYDKKKSKNEDQTKNLYIEGDNLEVLKLLRQSYYGAVKMIYIDPPYNTGNDFVYNDSFSLSKQESDIEEGVISDEGERYSVNKNSQNRFHAKWLNMIYPRLKIAKDLLCDDGFIFISIGEEELANLKKVCDEIFGEENFRNIISSRRYDKNLNLQFADEGLATMNVGLEYILVYSKNVEAKMVAVYRPADEDRANEGYWKGFWNNADRPTMRYDLFGFTPEEGQWKWKEDVAQEAVNNYKEYEEKYASSMSLEEYWKKTGSCKRFLRRNMAGKGKNMGVEHWVAPSSGILRTSNWSDMLISKPTGVDIPFDSPKNPELLQILCEIAGCEDDIVLDFFSGSASMAEAVMSYSIATGKNNRFIMVQVPEPTSEKSNAYKEGYSNICELGEERIRRVGDKLKANSNTDFDDGFKVFYVKDSNIKWNSLMEMGQLDITQLETTPDQIDFVQGFNDIDVVYELILRQRGVELSESVEKLDDIGERTYLYADSYLICLETELSAEIIEKISMLDPVPIKFFFRDSAFKDDIAFKDETFRRLKALVEKNTGETKTVYTVEFI